MFNFHVQIDRLNKFLMFVHLLLQSRVAAMELSAMRMRNVFSP